MKCEELTDLIHEHALGQLEPVRAHELQEHLATGCAVCLRALRESREAWCLLAAELEPTAPPPEMEEKLLSWIRTEKKILQERSSRDPSQLSQTSTAAVRKSRVIGLVLAASLLGVITSVATWRFLPASDRPLGGLGGPADHLTWGDPRANQSESRFTQVALEQIPQRAGVHLAVIGHPRTSEWHVFCMGLPTPVRDVTCKLWMETSAGEILSGTVLTVDTQGTASAVVKLPADISQLAGLKITVEQNAEAEEPSDQVLLRANFRQQKPAAVDVPTAR